MKSTRHKPIPRQFALPWALRFVFLSLLAATNALAATSLSIVSDQEYLPAVKLNGSARSLDVWGQFFKPSVSGRLYGIEIRAFHTQLMTADLEIEILGERKRATVLVDSPYDPENKELKA